MSNLIFFGTPDFAVPSLRALHQFCLSQGHNLVGVVCQPDKPAERGQCLKAPAVKECALELGLPVWQPVKITPDFVNWFKEQEIKLGVVVAYGKILPQSLLDASKLGFINVHGSLLPRWRGAAPIQRAIEAGDAETGVCIMNLVAELDAGEVYQTAVTPIGPHETSGELFERLSELGAQTLVNALPGILNQSLAKQAQSELGITYAHRLKKEEAQINWKKSALELVNHARAMQPWPGCYTVYHGKKIKLFGAQEIAREGSVGQILELGDKLVVGAGAGAVGFSEAQLEGKRRMRIKDLLNGFSMQVGDDLC